MPRISSPLERDFCAKCGMTLLKTPPGARAYPDFCSTCESAIFKTMERKGRVSEKFIRKLKR